MFLYFLCLISNTLSQLGTVFLAITISTPSLPPATDNLLQPSPYTPPPRHLQNRKSNQKQAKKSEGPSALQPITAYISKYTRTRTHVHTHTHTRAHAHACRFANAQTRTRADLLTRGRAHARIRTCAGSHTHTLAYAHSRALTHAHACTRARGNTRTCVDAKTRTDVKTFWRNLPGNQDYTFQPLFFSL